MAKRKMLNSKSWIEYLNETSEQAMWGYLDATTEIVSELDRILKRVDSFHELKNEITKLSNNRKKFINKVDPDKN